MPETFGKQEPGVIVQPCPIQSNQTYWIEIELVGMDNKGIPSEEFRIKFPDGEDVTGYLNSEGFARLSSIRTPGICQICFPKLDRDAWQFVESLPEKAAG
jgi:hypothetical protein